MRVLNPEPYVPDMAQVARLKAYMNGKTDVDFDELRGNIPEFADLADGEIQQVAQDAEFATSYR